jgi:hypothetical protein
VRVAATGSDAELVATVPITRDPGETKVVVMRLGRGDRPLSSLPDLAGGDLLRVMAEVEVTTDSPTWGGGVGRPYDFAPSVEASLVLAGDPEATEADGRRAMALADPRRVEITHRQHHRTIVFADAGVRVAAGGTPWTGPSSVNLVLSAHHPHAEEGQVLLVGENEPDGTVLPNKGRVSVVRLRRGADIRAEPAREDDPSVREIPVRKGERTVVYSLRIPDPEAHEQFAVRARMLTSAERLGFPARVSSRLILAEDPQQSEPGGRLRGLAAFRGAISPLNGFNCIPGQGPCVTEKVGVAALRRGPDRDLFVNLVAVSADPFGGARRRDALEVAEGGFVEAVRYPP